MQAAPWRAETASRGVESAELVVVRVVPTRIWHALVDDEVAGKAHVVRRPDRRYVVAIDAWRGEVFDALLDAVGRDVPHDLFTLVAESDHDELARWSRRGFEAGRREDEYEIPVDGSGGWAAPLPPGYALVPAADADLDALRRLDEELRQDVPGMRGWVNDPDEFTVGTPGSPPGDPATSLVAVEQATGVLVGLAWVSLARHWARLRLVGVRTRHRRLGLGRALVAVAVRPLPARGVELVLAEADAANPPAQALLAGFGFRRTGGTIELLRHGPADGR
jgi:ribosomal protein S18 acetylase RimI-like enzyme